MAGPRPERVYHQDYIARIRYSNTLPPPPNPPKLLDIPGTGLAGGQYTSAAFASRLAREQPLNIEADAELGMPIDLIGLPGVFDGDERAIMARSPAPPIHAHDRALLKPLSALGKPTTMNAGVSFLRRTEYISSSQGGQRFESSTSKDLLRVRNDPKRKRKPNVNKDDPINIIRSLVKGFDIAYPRDAYKGEDSQINIRGAEITSEDSKAWSKPKHPTKPHLELLDDYPLLPDLEALPTAEAYQVAKFSVNPIGDAEEYDSRLDVAILRPTNTDLEKYEDRLAARLDDPTLPRPTPEFEYDLFLAEGDESTVRGIKRKFDTNDPDNDDESLYEREYENGGAFYYKFIRNYETYQQAGDADDVYGDTVALAVHDPDLHVAAASNKRLKKGAYYYPVKQRTNLRPKRKTNVRGQQNNVAEHVDGIVVRTRDQDMWEMQDRLRVQNRLDPSIEVPSLPGQSQDHTQEEGEGQEERDADADADADGDDADE